MKLSIYKFCFLVFITYWIITVFFVFPQNPLNLSAEKGKEFFHANFFQTWSFFAPPPNFNDRLYVVLTNKKSGAIDVIDLLGPVLDEKHRRAPFNSYHQAVDYIINSSMAVIETNIRTMYNVLNYEKEFMNRRLPDSVMRDSVISRIEKTPGFNTIVKYVRKVMNENKIAPSDVTYQVKIAKRYNPQFIDRYTKKLPDEEVTFAGHVMNF